MDTGKYFYVEIAKPLKNSRILNNTCVAGYILDPNANLLKIPIEYKVNFEENINCALKDIAGVIE